MSIITNQRSSQSGQHAVAGLSSQPYALDANCLSFQLANPKQPLGALLIMLCSFSDSDGGS
jgi:hypothetical protein